MALAAEFCAGQLEIEGLISFWALRVGGVHLRDGVLDSTGIDPNLGTSLTQTGWRIYVEVKSAGAYLAAASDRQDSASHLKLHKRLNVLVYLLRGELKRADGPTPPTAMQGDNVESLTLNLIGTLEGVLSHWPTDHLALSTNNSSASAATTIPELETELKTLVNAINTTAGKLGELLGVVEAA